MNISDYKIIGNLKTAALVASGSIDWLCKPDFDSPSIFTRILDEEAGSFSVISDEDYQVSSEYLQDTAIVQTKYAKEGKSFILKDFMIPEFDIEPDVLVRKIKGLKGKNNVNMVFNPRPDYGKTSPKFEIKKNKIVLKNAHANISLLVPKGEIIHTDKGLEINFVIQENESLEFILKISDEYFDSSSHDLEKETVNYWKKWLDKGKFFDFCEDRLKRTAITLKLMQYSPTGAIIAAPTTSLPEEIGGERNWDYRYTWVRDATFTLYGLYVLDYIEEAEAYFSFIENIVEFDDEGYADFKLMYTVEGKNIPDEETLDHLAGYKNSKPVRIGNEAGDQFQLDLYGSIIDAYYFMEEKGLEISENGKK